MKKQECAYEYEEPKMVTQLQVLDSRGITSQYADWDNDTQMRVHNLLIGLQSKLRMGGLLTEEEDGSPRVWLEGVEMLGDNVIFDLGVVPKSTIGETASYLSSSLYLKCEVVFQNIRVRVR